nr:immunoglobulin light chain junction region [Macaca mulatta]MOW57138.1 immunoglobulin light chain junction region [Macaca mulatta]MOW57349.1 immunoglobulin light chain junction region [Macaca mulatta]MOW57997.1 immunoglobulin light chain junction region [Macaca mulatta]MOW57999.1 immunoglobulin light chain junction region [Macaca mulatta]
DYYCQSYDRSGNMLF